MRKAFLLDFRDLFLIQRSLSKGSKATAQIVEYQDTLSNTSFGQWQYLLINGGTAGSAVLKRYFRQLVITGQSFLRQDVSFIVPQHRQNKQKLRKVSLNSVEREEMKTLEDYLAREGNFEEEVQTHIPLAKLNIFFI